jgi:hypothetical protein
MSLEDQEEEEIDESKENVVEEPIDMEEAESSVNQSKEKTAEKEDEDDYEDDHEEEEQK